MFLSWILKTYMTNVSRTSPERPIIWSPWRPATVSRRRSVDVPIYNFWIFVFPVKYSYSRVKQRLLHLKNTFFFIKSSFFVLVPYESPKSPLKVRDVRTFRGSSWDVPVMRLFWVDALDLLTSIPSETSILS